MNENKLEIKYIPLTHIVPTYQNSKLHDIGGLIESIFQYGFKVPISVQSVIDFETLDSHYLEMLNNGEEIYALLAGNGRCEAVTEINKLVNRGDKALPDGLIIKDGLISIPAVLGMDLETVELFESFSLDDNLIPLSASNMTPLEMSQLFDADDFLAMLKRNINTVQSIDGSDLDLLLELHKSDMEEPLEFDEPEPPIDDKPKSYAYSVRFDTEIDLQDFKQYLVDKREEYPSNTNDAFIILDAIGLV